MSTFPVLDSILSPQPIAQFIRDKYGLSASTHARVLRTGINHSYFISDQGKKYVFRVYSYQWRTENEILEEITFLNLLAENHISVSYPLPDISGTFIQTIEAPEGLRYAALFSYAEGDKIRNLTDAHCYSIGSLIAQIHKLSANRTVNRITYDAHTLTRLPYQYAKEHFNEALPEMKYIKLAGDYAASVLDQLTPEQLRYGTVHLDIWYDNMNIAPDGKITLFDFDFCGNGWLLLDVAYTITQLFHTEPDKEKFKAKQESFFSGYKAVTPMDSAEKQLLPVAGLAIWIFYLGVQSQRFNNWSNIFLTKNYLKHYTGLLKSWLAYHEITIDEL